ncbi:MAG TPA: methyltransferase domain-containing protein [Candidatus Andersenbacteria bacterium]|nr:methyltransferase domain-containing protein [Candidatus Andersenbacteria bacterium]
MAERTPFIRPDTFWHSLMLRANQTVVHLGCGAGFYIIPAARIVGKKGKAIGVDILPDMLAEVENKAHQYGLEAIIKTYRANIENTPGSPIDDRSMDWVLVANILHQSNPDKVFQEAYRIVSNQGHVVVVGWSTAATPLGPPNEKRISEDEVKQIAQQHGLVLVQEFAPSPYHYGLVLSPQEHV